MIDDDGSDCLSRLLEAANDLILIGYSSQVKLVFRSRPGAKPQHSRKHGLSFCSAILAGRIPGMSDMPIPFGLVFVASCNMQVCAW